MPRFLVFVSYCTRVRLLTTMISAPGIDFASASKTIPPIEPVGDCANTEEHKATANTAARITRTNTPFANEICTVNSATLRHLPTYRTEIGPRAPSPLAPSRYYGFNPQ